MMFVHCMRRVLSYRARTVLRMCGWSGYVGDMRLIRLAFQPILQRAVPIEMRVDEAWGVHAPGIRVDG